MHEFLFRSWAPSINVVENAQNYTIGSKHGSTWRKKTVSHCCTRTWWSFIRTLLRYLTSLMHRISIVILAVWTWAKCDLQRRNLAFAIKRYKQLLWFSIFKQSWTSTFFINILMGVGRKEPHMPRLLKNKDFWKIQLYYILMTCV